MVAAIAIGVSLAIAAYQAKKQRDAAKQVERQGTLQRQGMESQAGLSDFNARVALLQADDAIARGKEEEDRFRQGIEVAIGGQRAGFAAMNVDVGFGSAVDVQADAAYLGELDALTIRTNAAREAWGYRVQAEDYRMRADITRREGINLEAGAGVTAGQMRTQAWVGLATTGSSLLLKRYGFRQSAPAGSGSGTGSSYSPNFSAGTASFAATAPIRSTYAGAFRGVRF
jgi:hypothetical protein